VGVCMCVCMDMGAVMCLFVCGVCVCVCVWNVYVCIGSHVYVCIPRRQKILEADTPFVHTHDNDLELAEDNHQLFSSLGLNFGSNVEPMSDEDMVLHGPTLNSARKLIRQTHVITLWARCGQQQMDPTGR
jgi:hypothetical protein